MVMIEDRVWFRLSAIIAICGENFCAFLADRRRTTNVGDNYVVHDDETQKIFALNKSVLYGMTGLFSKHTETLTSAVDSIDNIENATLEDVLEAVLSYLDRRKYEIPPQRSYLIGGKNKEGKFCVYEVHMNFITYKPEVILRTPNQPGAFTVSISLPFKASENLDEYIKMVETAVLSSKTVEDALRKSYGVIQEIAKVDETVGTTGDVLLIH